MSSLIRIIITAFVVTTIASALFLTGLYIGVTNVSTLKPATVKQADSTEYAVYTARPVDYPEDCVPVYIPLDMLGICGPMDGVYIDTATNILAPMPLRDAETHQVARCYQRVVIEKRLEQNKKFPLKH